MATAHDFTGLNVKVQSLESDVHELKVGFNALAGEMRTGFNALSQALAERARTPWVSIASAAGVIVTVLAFIGQLAIAPLQTDVTLLKHEIVSRTEHDWRDRALDDRLTAFKAEFEHRHADLKSYVSTSDEALQRAADIERAAVHASLDRLFTDLQALRLSTTIEAKSKPPN